MKVYLAGPMTGLPKYNYPAFFDAEIKVMDCYPGAEVSNPARINWDDKGEQGSLPYETYLEAGYRLLMNCDTICLLPGWSKSTGAKNELTLALSLGYKVLHIDEYGDVRFIG